MNMIKLDSGVYVNSENVSSVAAFDEPPRVVTRAKNNFVYVTEFPTIDEAQSMAKDVSDQCDE